MKRRKTRLKKPDNLPPMGEGNWWQNLRQVAYYHRFVFTAFKHSQGWHKAAIFLFLALIFYDAAYSTVFVANTILTGGPAMAFAPGLDITTLGEATGQALFDGAWDQMERLYRGEFGIRAAVSQVALFVAAPIAATAVVMGLGEDEEISTALRKPWAIGSFIVVVLLSGGGALFGQLFVALVDSGEAVLRVVTEGLQVYDSISSAKGFLSVGSAISASVSECQKFVGQEQNQCVFEASSAAIGTIANVKATIGGAAPWADFRTEQLTQVAQDILNPNTTLEQKAFAQFMSFSAPIFETVMAIVANTMLVVFDIGYALFVSFFGFTLPLAAVSSLLSPVVRSQMVGWGITLFQAWWFRALYLMGAWAMSRLLLSASAAEFTQTSWFSAIMIVVLPWIIKGIVTKAGDGMYQGILAAQGSAARGTAEMAGSAAVGAATGGTSVAASAGAGAASKAANSSGDVSKPPRVAID